MKTGISTAALLTLAGAALSAAGTAYADEGMWTLDNLPVARMEADYGFRPEESWVEKVRLASVRLANGCSGSFVSGTGLVLTNHHCIARCISELTTAKDDLQANGFLARRPEEERRCAGIEINQLSEIRDVTADMARATAGKTGAALNEARTAAIAELEKTCATDETTRCDVVTLYQGGRYSLYKYKRYKDVRLVFAPEADVAAFGGDPDNFNFPRWCLDMGILRVYGSDGKPIASPHYFRWAAKGAAEDDMTFITGHPGSTSRLRTVAELEVLRDAFLPRQLILDSELRGRLLQFAQQGLDQERMALREIQGLENSLKVQKGRHAALVDAEFFGAKLAAEQDLRRRIAADPALAAEVGDAYEQIGKAAARYRVLLPRHAMLEGGGAFKGQLAEFARHLLRAGEERGKPGAQRLKEYSDARLPVLVQRLTNPAPVHSELETVLLSYSLDKLREAFGPDDRLVKAVLQGRSPAERAAELVANSKLGDPAVRQALFEGGKDAVAASDDPMIKLMALVDADARALRKAMEEEVETPIEAAQARIAKARFALFGESIYPDATFSLRLSYGAVKGWTEPDGTEVAPFTTLAGLYDRATGSQPFALPESWIKARSKLDLSTPFNAATTNDIIGGNSGSPVLNRKAEIIGLVFDGNIHSLAGNYGYDSRRNRAVMVDLRGMKEALHKVYDAKALIRELGL